MDLMLLRSAGRKNTFSLLSDELHDKISMEPDLYFINIFIATCSQYNRQHQ